MSTELKLSATAINNGIKYLKEISLASRAGSKKSGR
nr:MAG TPA: hypothetical protein [Caudoviricetes sp.]